MSQKRPRQPAVAVIQPHNAVTTTGPVVAAPPILAAGTTSERESKVSTAWQFDDFRRRHSKQNKDIIKMNFELKIALATVQKELAILRSEIIETKMRNSALSRELRFRGSGHSGRASEVQVQRQAVETILAAVPALQQLLSSTLNIPPSSTEQRILDLRSAETVPASAQMPLVFTVRPAASAAKEHTLGTLAEGSECGSELDVGDMEERPRVKTIYRPRISGLASRSNRSISPPPLGLHQAINPVLPVRPPSPISSPLTSPRPPRPVARASPRARKGRGEKTRRRRESGLLKPLSPGSLDDDPAQSGGKGGEEIIEGPVDIGDANEDEGRMADEEAVLDLIEEARSTGHTGENHEPQSLAEMADSTKPQGKSRIINPPVTETSAAGTSSNQQTAQKAAIASQGVLPLLLMEEETAVEEAEEGIGRGRRSRNSVVSYKEPSLNKKMRKPDGTTVEDALKGSSRASLAAGTDPSTTTTEPSSSSSSSSKSSRSTFDTAQALRRKSALPRAGHTDEEGDEIRQGSGVSREDSLTPPPPLDFRVSQVEYSVSKNSGRTIDDPVSISSSSSTSLVFQPGPGIQSSTARISPKKSPKNQHGGPSYARPSSSSTNKRTALPVQVIKGRDPLVDRLENGLVGRRGGGVGVGAVREIGKTLVGGAATRAAR